MSRPYVCEAKEIIFFQSDKLLKFRLSRNKKKILPKLFKENKPSRH